MTPVLLRLVSTALRTARPPSGGRAIALLGAGLAVVACGDDAGATDASTTGDGTALDAPSYPPPPALGAQVDRRGRPGIETLLVAPLEASVPRQTAMKEAYERASDPATWATFVLDPNAIPPRTIRAELAANLGMFDGLDAGHPDVSQAGCGNSLLYAGPPSATSYLPLAAFLADDRLYLDTEKTVCDRYFALELGAVLGSTTGCGGRALTNDAIDVSYSLLLGGAGGFTALPALQPRIGDGAGAHADVLDATFPFLGTPR